MEEEVQASRGVGVDEACVHPPQYLATIISPEVPPYFPNFENYLGPLQSLLGCQSPPCPTPVHVGVCGGVKSFLSLRPKFRQGFLPICQIEEFPGPIAASDRTPVA